MNSNINIFRTIWKFQLDEWNFISFQVSCEGVYFVMLNNIEMIFNSNDRNEAERVYRDMLK